MKNKLLPLLLLLHNGCSEAVVMLLFYAKTFVGMPSSKHSLSPSVEGTRSTQVLQLRAIHEPRICRNVDSAVAVAVAAVFRSPPIATNHPTSGWRRYHHRWSCVKCSFYLLSGWLIAWFEIEVRCSAYESLIFFIAGNMEVSTTFVEWLWSLRVSTFSSARQEETKAVFIRTTQWWWWWWCSDNDSIAIDRGIDTRYDYTQYTPLNNSCWSSWDDGVQFSSRLLNRTIADVDVIYVKYAPGISLELCHVYIYWSYWGERVVFRNSHCSQLPRDKMWHSLLVLSFHLFIWNPWCVCSLPTSPPTPAMQSMRKYYSMNAWSIEDHTSVLWF